MFGRDISSSRSVRSVVNIDAEAIFSAFFNGSTLHTWSFVSVDPSFPDDVASECRGIYLVVGIM